MKSPTPTEAAHTIFETERSRVRLCLEGSLRRSASGIGGEKLRRRRNQRDLKGAVAPLENERDRCPGSGMSRLAQGQSAMNIAAAAAAIANGWTRTFRIVAMMPCHAAAARMWRSCAGGERDRRKIAQEGKQQQRSGGHTMHGCSAKETPRLATSIEYGREAGQTQPGKHSAKTVSSRGTDSDWGAGAIS